MLVGTSNPGEPQTPWFNMGCSILIIVSLLWIVVSFNVLKTNHTIILAVVLLIGAGFLSFYNIKSIGKTLEFNSLQKGRMDVVKEKLLTLKDAQLLYRNRYGLYCNNMDSLIHFLKNDSIYVIIATGDYKDSIAVAEGKVKVDTNWVLVSDTLFTRFPFDSLKFVPFTKDSLFTNQAGTVYTDDGRENPVFQIHTNFRVFLNELYAIEYGEGNMAADSLIKVGSMTTPTTNGNWND